VIPFVDMCDGVTFFGQPAHDEISDPRLVLDN